MTEHLLDDVRHCARQFVKLLVERAKELVDSHGSSLTWQTMRFAGGLPAGDRAGFGTLDPDASRLQESLTSQASSARRTGGARRPSFLVSPASRGTRAIYPRASSPITTPDFEFKLTMPFAFAVPAGSS